MTCCRLSRLRVAYVYFKGKGTWLVIPAVCVLWDTHWLGCQNVTSSWDHKKIYCIYDWEANGFVSNIFDIRVPPSSFCNYEGTEKRNNILRIYVYIHIVLSIFNWLYSGASLLFSNILPEARLPTNGWIKMYQDLQNWTESGIIYQWWHTQNCPVPCPKKWFLGGDSAVGIILCHSQHVSNGCLCSNRNQQQRSTANHWQLIHI